MLYVLSVLPFYFLHTVLVLNPNLEDRVPKTSPRRLMTRDLAPLIPLAKREKQSLSPPVKIGNTNLEWQTWTNSLPHGAVSIYNDYTRRTDYVCKYRCDAGFYSPSLGPHCRYAYGGKEKLSSSFSILVNSNNFELLEWKEGSYGSVPQNSINTCSGINVYIGKNNYGLGKVVPQHKAFFLPYKGKEYWYKHYQVLTLNKGISKEQIYDVKYKTDGVEIISYPPETMRKSAITNNECRPVEKTVSISKTNEVQHRWDTSFSITAGVKSSITAKIPIIGSTGIEFSTETTKQFSKGTTVVESHSHSVSLKQDVPPNHTCAVSMLGYKYKADIPFTARLKRTYSNGKTTWKLITGTYDSVEVGEVRAVVDRCEPIPDAKPCA
uniref:Natterin-3 n=1 Tax=Anabas testudineus TaxID=64144 RepID=A0A3Q1JIG9_ANATE